MTTFNHCEKQVRRPVTWYTNELTVWRMNFVSPPSSPPKEIMKVVKHLDIFHMDISTSYKVRVHLIRGQLGELKTTRREWKGEWRQEKQLTFKREKSTPNQISPATSCISQHATEIKWLREDCHNKVLANGWTSFVENFCPKHFHIFLKTGLVVTST